MVFDVPGVSQEWLARRPSLQANAKQLGMSGGLRQVAWGWKHSILGGHPGLERGRPRQAQGSGAAGHRAPRRVSWTPHQAPSWARVGLGGRWPRRARSWGNASGSGGGNIWRRSLGRGKVGTFLLFILYCAEVTEFVLCTSNVFIKTTINAETK